MKYLRSKSMGTNRRAVGTSIGRVRKVFSEIRELSTRNWKGGEASAAAEVNAAMRHLETALESLEEAEAAMGRAERIAKSKGK